MKKYIESDLLIDRDPEEWRRRFDACYEPEEKFNKEDVIVGGIKLFIFIELVLAMIFI